MCQNCCNMGCKYRFMTQKQKMATMETESVNPFYWGYKDNHLYLFCQNKQPDSLDVSPDRKPIVVMSVR